MSAKLSAFEIWRKRKTDRLTNDQTHQLFVDNGIIVESICHCYSYPPFPPANEVLNGKCSQCGKNLSRFVKVI